MEASLINIASQIPKHRTPNGPLGLPVVSGKHIAKRSVGVLVGIRGRVGEICL